MEYTQWVWLHGQKQKDCTSLNPCCNGIYSMRRLTSSLSKVLPVLILVVMEYTQWDGTENQTQTTKVVLILVVMEYTQWVIFGLNAQWPILS